MPLGLFLGHHKGPSGKIIQRQGMALKRGMPVRLGWMPGISRFRGQAKVGDAQIIDDFDLFVKPGKIGLGPDHRMDEHQTKKQKVAQEEQHEFIGFSQKPNPFA
jgi:hypothetical protein